MNKKKKGNKKSKAKRLHTYYHYTGFYSFVNESVKKSIVPILITLVAIFIIDYFIFDFSDFFKYITETFSPTVILSVFFASESLLGLVPPEIFIAWAGKMPTPYLYLVLLALASYSGGIISFFVGKSISNFPRVHNYLEGKMEKQLKMIRKWGGFLIVVGALLPIPFAITSVAAGLIHYKFRNYLLFGLLRFVRFYLYALVIFNIVS